MSTNADALHDQDRETKETTEHNSALVFTSIHKPSGFKTSDKSVGPLTIALKGTKLSDEERRLLGCRRSDGKNKFSEYLVGGVILSKVNWDEKSETRLAELNDLIAEIKKINPNIATMADHEGGPVWRFQYPKSGIDDLIGGVRKDKYATLLVMPDYKGAAIYCFADPKINVDDLIAHIQKIDPSIRFKEDRKGKAMIWRFESTKIPKIDPVVEKLPRAKYFGELYDRDPEEALAEASRYGFKMAKELQENCHIDFSLSPVLDLHDDRSKIIGQWGRAFHSKAEIVLLISKAFIQGMNAAGMSATLKHFPGHGKCAEDSHSAFPVDASPMTTLVSNYYPFEGAIRDTKLDIGMVMMAHVTYPSVDSINTAGYSEKWITKLRKMGFDGVVISDCLSMSGAGLKEKDSVVGRLKSASEAGCDILLMVQKTDAIDDILKAELLIPDNAKSAERRLALFEKCCIRRVVKKGVS